METGTKNKSKYLTLPQWEQLEILMWQGYGVEFVSEHRTPDMLFILFNEIHTERTFIVMIGKSIHNNNISLKGIFEKQS